MGPLQQRNDQKLVIARSGWRPIVAAIIDKGGDRGCSVERNRPDRARDGPDRLDFYPVTPKTQNFYPPSENSKREQIKQAIKRTLPYIYIIWECPFN